MSGSGLLVADALVLLGVAVITLAIWGVLRIPSAYVKMHAANTAVLGVLLIGFATLLASEPAVIVRALLVGLFLMITTPVGTHALARLERSARREGGSEPESG